MLGHFLDGLYGAAQKAGHEDTTTSVVKPSWAWLHVQNLALEDNDQSDKEIEMAVLEAQRLSVKLPIVRKAKTKGEVKDEKNDTTLFTLEKDQTIVCDIVSSQLYSVQLQ